MIPQETPDRIHRPRPVAARAANTNNPGVKPATVVASKDSPNRATPNSHDRDSHNNDNLARDSHSRDNPNSLSKDSRSNASQKNDSTKKATQTDSSLKRGKDSVTTIPTTPRPSDSASIRSVSLSRPSSQDALLIWANTTGGGLIAGGGQGHPLRPE